MLAPKPALDVDPNDPCGVQRADFAKSKGYFTEQIVAGVATGALLGAVTGIGVALITHGNVGTGALIGAGTGAIAGGTTAYAKTMVQQSKDQEELARNINTDLAKEGDQIDHTTASFARLRECRFGQAHFIKAEVRAHRMDHATALAQISYERDRFSEEIALARQYSITMAKRDDQFQDAANQVRQDQAASAAAVQQAALVKTAASVSIPEKRSSFDKSINSADSNSKVAFSLDSSAKFSLLERLADHV